MPSQGNISEIVAAIIWFCTTRGQDRKTTALDKWWKRQIHPQMSGIWRQVMILMIANIIINIIIIVDYDSNDAQTASLVVCLIRLQLGCFSALIVSLLLQSSKFAFKLINRMITLLIRLMIMWTMAMITYGRYFFYTITMRFATEKFNTTDKAQGILIGGSSACLGSAKLDWFLCFLLPRLFSYSSFTIRGGGICIETSS